MADIRIFVAQNETELGLSSAIGFFGGNGFGDPIPLNEFNGRTFVTNISGSVQGLEIDNCKLIKSVPEWNGINGPSGVIIGQAGSGIGILNLPNYLATMNVRFLNVSPVLVQNANITVHNGDQISPPSGLNVYMAEVVHPTELQTDNGTGDFRWLLMAGFGSGLGLSDSPGVSGTFPIGGQDSRHDWYVPISVSPTLPGNKVFYFTVTLEYI